MTKDDARNILRLTHNALSDLSEAIFLLEDSQDHCNIAKSLESIQRQLVHLGLDDYLIEEAT